MSYCVIAGLIFLFFILKNCLTKKEDGGNIGRISFKVTRAKKTETGISYSNFFFLVKYSCPPKTNKENFAIFIYQLVMEWFDLTHIDDKIDLKSITESVIENTIRAGGKIINIETKTSITDFHGWPKYIFPISFPTR